MSAADYGLYKEGRDWPELFGDINDLRPFQQGRQHPLELASHARIRYPVTCLASARPAARRWVSSGFAGCGRMSRNG
ncbi:MAG: hypothetical protein OJF48_000279 [Afipia sp.]|nr:MAG: hypothetical protein OJF48_000279 [Afipia sp.]